MKTMFHVLAFITFSAVAASAPILLPAGMPTTGMIISQMNIGDFDGDQSDDVLLFWQDYSITTHVYTNIFGVYSSKKNIYLLTQNYTSPLVTTGVIVGKFTGNGLCCFIYDGTLYSY